MGTGKHFHRAVGRQERGENGGKTAASVISSPKTLKLFRKSRRHSRNFFQPAGR